MLDGWLLLRGRIIRGALEDIKWGDSFTSLGVMHRRTVAGRLQKKDVGTCTSGISDGNSAADFCCTDVRFTRAFCPARRLSLFLSEA